MADVKRHRHDGLKGELIILLGQLPCDGPDPQLGGCPDRRHGMCREVEKLDYCAVQALADHLIASGVTVQKWISVTERLPQEGERVLFTDGIWTGEGYINKRGKWQRYQNLSYMDVMVLDVTHRMALPQPPGEGSP